MSRGFDPTSGRVKDPVFVRRYFALVRAILGMETDRLDALRLITSQDLESAADLPSPTAQRREGRELIIFRRLAETSGYGFCVADIKGMISYANRSLCRLLAEHAPEGLIGRNIISCYPEDVQESFAINIIPTVVKNGQWVGELPLQSSSGTRTPTLQNLFVVHGEKGASPYLANLIIDITDRKRAEEALRQSEERYRALIENMKDAVYTIDKVGRITYISKAIEAFTGYRPEEIVGRSFREFIYQDDREMSERRFRQLLEGKVSGPLEFRVLTKSVDVRWVRSSSRPMVAGGETVGVQGVVTDITASKRVEQALQKSEEKFSKAFMLSPHSMFIYRLSDGEILEVNEGFLRATGHSKREVVGKSLHALEYWARPGGQESFLRVLSEAGKASSAEAALRSSDGRLIPVHMTARSIEIDGVACAICVARDISDHRRAEAFMRRQRELMHELHTAESLEEATRICLEAALEVSEMDAGTYHQVIRETGDLVLVYATGLSPEFVGRVRHIASDSDRARLVMEGRPIYALFEELGTPGMEPKGGEGLRATGLIPVLREGRAVGVLNVHSHVRNDVPAAVRDPLESIAAQIGGVVGEAEAAEALRASEENYFLLLKSMEEGVAWHRLIFDTKDEPVDYELVEANPAFERILGLDRESILGQRSCLVYGGVQPFMFGVFRRVALTGAAAAFEAEHPRGGKRLRYRVYSPRSGEFVTLVQHAGEAESSGAAANE